MKRICTISISAILFIGIFAYYNDHLSDCFIYYNESIETLSYIAVIVSVIFVAYQAWLFRKDYNNKKEHAEFEKSYELAGYYAKNIIPKMSFINLFSGKN